MTLPEQLSELIDRHILSFPGFAIYRLPSTNEMGLVIQSDGEVITLDEAQQLNEAKGFAMIPYASRSLPLIVIKPEITAFTISDVVSTLEALPQSKGKSIKVLPTHIASKDEYHEAFEAIIARLRDTQLDKVVLARSSQAEAIPSFGSVFVRACQQNPDSFVYLCNTQHSGVWLGATPETLIARKDSDFTTMALAGTRPASAHSEPWSTKNLEEQQYVSDFITRRISAVAANVHVSPTTTRQAGNVEHLCSHFSFASELGIGDLVNLLHPTPAVCGMPQGLASDIIDNIEPNSRLYYSGAVGIVGLPQSDALYVNLRCLYANDHTTTLFAGGGILEQSDVEAEWKETEAKMKTIYSIL